MAIETSEQRTMHELNLSGTEFADIAAEILNKGGSFTFVALGSSMLPFVRSKDAVTVIPVSLNMPLAKGDIVLYQSPAAGGIVVHRITGFKRKNLLIRGDFVFGRPEMVEKRRVWGKVKSAERAGKSIKTDSKVWRWAGRLWILLYPASLFLLRLALKVRRIIKKITDRNAASIQHPLNPPKGDFMRKK
jgi:hypothetical protein